MKLRERYPLREDAFDDAENDPAAAYWVGQMMTDGHVTRHANGRLYASFGQSVEDIAHVEAFRSFVGAVNHTITIDRHQNNAYRNSRPFAKIAFSSDRMTLSLARYGVVERKSSTAEAKLLADSPDFWRGCVDGDGSLGINNTRRYLMPILQFGGSRQLCEQFRRFALARVSGIRAKVNPSGPIFTFRVAGVFAKKLSALLYREGIPSLPRKAAVARDIAAWTYNNHVHVH